MIGFGRCFFVFFYFDSAENVTLAIKKNQSLQMTKSLVSPTTQLSGGVLHTRLPALPRG